MHDQLKTSIIQSLEDEKKVNASVRKKITDEINVIDNRLKHLWEYFLDRGITENQYKLEKQKYLDQRKELEERSKKYTDISNTLKDDVEKALDFIADISNVMKIATPDEKNTLLKNLLTNCILDGDVLKYEIKAPFDKLLSCSNYKKWKDIALDNINDFENCIQE